MDVGRFIQPALNKLRFIRGYTAPRLLNFRGIFTLVIDWRASTTLILTALVSVGCWLGFALSVTRLQNQLLGLAFLLVAILSLVRFGQLLDRRLAGVL